MSRPSALDTPLSSRTETPVSHSAFAFLFSEICSRAQTQPTKAKNIDEWEGRLASMGFTVGQRSVQLIALKDQQREFSQRKRQIQDPSNGILDLIAYTLWPKWFGSKASIQLGEDNVYFLVDPEPYVTKYIRMTRDFIGDDGIPQISFASYVAGMVSGVLDACGFPAEVLARPGPNEKGTTPNNTYFQITFEKHVLERDAR